jgi:GLPGLI family protein
MIKQVFKIALFIFFLVNNALAQNGLRQGKIFYEMDFPEIPPAQKAEIADLLPKDATAYFKNGNTRVEMPMPFGKLIIIRDSSKKQFVFAFNNVEKKKKVAFIKTDEEIKKMNKDSNAIKTTVTITKETKKIAGYTATKAIISFEVKGKTVTTECWFSKEIPKVNMGGEQDFLFNQLEGGLLEYTTMQGDMKTIMRIRQIVFEETNDKLFELGPSYKLVKNEEELTEEMIK